MENQHIMHGVEWHGHGSGSGADYDALVRYQHGWTPSSWIHVRIWRKKAKARWIRTHPDDFRWRMNSPQNGMTWWAKVSGFATSNWVFPRIWTKPWRTWLGRRLNLNMSPFDDPSASRDWLVIGAIFEAVIIDTATEVETRSPFCMTILLVLNVGNGGMWWLLIVIDWIILPFPYV